MKISPTTKPRLSSKQLLAILRKHRIKQEDHPLIIVGIRGYYKRTMGNPKKNDRGVYDDAIFINTPNVSVSFNANTDPSYFRVGKGFGNTKGMARLNAGFWKVYSFGMHKGRYLALVQTHGPVEVTRDGDPGYHDKGFFGINIHSGGYYKTSSLGCQTIYPAQWKSFIQLMLSEAKRVYGRKWDRVAIPYLLIEE